MCKGYSTTVTDTTVGGVWGSGSLAIATVITGVPGTVGMVTGASGGVTMISYTLGTGCSSAAAINVIEVPAITGPDRLCAYGDTVHLYDATPGGSWTSTLVTMSVTGVATGFAAGTAQTIC